MWNSASNKLKIFIDPLMFANNKHLNEEVNIKLMEDYIKRSNPVLCDINFCYPKKIAESLDLNSKLVFKNINFIDDTPDGVDVNEIFGLLKDIEKNVKDIQGKAVEWNNQILKIAVKEKCHIFATESQYYLTDKLKFKDDPILISDLDELLNYMEVFLSGFYNFFKFDFPVYGITEPDIAHLMTDKLFKEVLTKISDSIDTTNPALREISRTIFFNRYPDILITIDKIKFYHLQRKMDTIEHGESNLPAFNSYFRYYINVYYTQLWSLCENFAWLINYIFNLEFDIDVVNDRYAVGLSSKKEKFYEKLDKHKSPVRDYLRSKDFQDWLEVIADVRHQNSHRTLNIASALLVTDKETEKLTDEEIDKIIYPDGKVVDNEELFSEEFIENQKKFDRQKYRISKSKKALDTFIILNKNGKQKYFCPISRIKIDLEVLEKLFKNLLISIK